MLFDFDIGLPARGGLRCGACGALDPRVENDGRYVCGQCQRDLAVRLTPIQLELDL